MVHLALIPEVTAPTMVRAADPSQDGGKREIAFIDTSVADYQTLIDGVRPGVEIELIDGGQSGLAQMALREALARSVAQSGADTIVLSNLTTGDTITLTDSTATLGTGDTLSESGGKTLTIAGSSGGGLVLTGANTVAVGNSGSALTISANISGSGSLTKTQGYGLTLSGTNTYSGGTTVSNGTMTLNGGSALADAGALTVNSTGGAGGTYGLILGADETIGSLAGSGKIDLGSHTVTTGGAGTNTEFSGVISGSGGLTKAGSGTGLAREKWRAF